MASPSLVWQLVKDNHCYIVQNNRLRLTREPGNLTGRNTFRDSVFTHAAVMDLRPAGPDGKWALTKTSSKAELATKPAKRQHTVILRRCSFKKLARTIRNTTTRQLHRPELTRLALRRAALLWRAYHRHSVAKALEAKAKPTTPTGDH